MSKIHRTRHVASLDSSHSHGIHHHPGGCLAQIHITSPTCKAELPACIPNCPHLASLRRMLYRRLALNPNTPFQLADSLQWNLPFSQILRLSVQLHSMPSPTTTRFLFPSLSQIYTFSILNWPDPGSAL